MTRERQLPLEAGAEASGTNHRREWRSDRGSLTLPRSLEISGRRPSGSR
jgi:hypothetical protein